MSGKNKYSWRARISEAKLRELVRLFCLDLTASQIAYVSRVNRNTVNRYLNLIRRRLAAHCEAASPILHEPLAPLTEADPETLALAGAPIFGIVQRGGKVYTELVPAFAAPAVRALLARGMGGELPQFSGYDGLVDLGAARPFHALETPDPDGSSRSGSHRTSMARSGLAGSFWAFAKGRLAKFNGVARSTFHLHLKECEFRFNAGLGSDPEAGYRLLLDILRRRPLN